MKLITLVFTLTSCFLYAKQNLIASYPGEETKILPGIILYNTGEVSFIEGYLDLVVSLKCPSDIRELIIKLVKTSAQISNVILPAFTPKFKNISIAYEAYKWDHELLMIRAKTILNNLNELGDLPWISTRVKRNRNKRAAFEFGGDILQSLFGTATNKQIRMLRRKINLLGNYATTSDTLIRELKDQLKSNTEVIVEFRERLMSLIKFQDKISAVINIMSQLNSIKSFLNLIEQTASNIRAIYHTVITSIQLAKNKITNDDLYSPAFFLPFVIQMSKLNMLHPVIPLTTENYHSFITYSWTIQSSSDPYEIITLIPFISAETFSAYRLIPFPTHLPINNSTARVIYNEPNNYVFINHGLRKYTYLKESAHDFCRNLGRKSICPLSQPFSSVDDHTCLLSLLRNQTSNFLYCPMEAYRFNDPFTVTLGHFSIISLPKKTQASISCKNPSSTQHINGYVFVIPHGCTFTTASFHFKNPIHLEKNISLATLIAQSDQVLFNYMSHMALPNISSVLFPKSKYLKEITWNTRLDKLNQTIHPFSPFLPQIKYIPYLGGSITSIIFCIFCFAVIYCGWLYRMTICRRCLIPSLPTPEEIPLNPPPEPVVHTNLQRNSEPSNSLPSTSTNPETTVSTVNQRQMMIVKPPCPPPLPTILSVGREVEIYSNAI